MPKLGVIDQPIAPFSRDGRSAGLQAVAFEPLGSCLPQEHGTVANRPQSAYIARAFSTSETLQRLVPPGAGGTKTCLLEPEWPISTP